jgi:hypothetical protein
LEILDNQEQNEEVWSARYVYEKVSVHDGLAFFRTWKERNVSTFYNLYWHIRDKTAEL